MGDISSTLFTIDISWDFADIQPTESNNRLFNFPLPNKRDRVIPYMSHIYFDISSSTGDIIDFSANIEIDSSHNYAEDSKAVSGNIDSTGGDLSYNLTYRTLTLTKFSEDTRTYTVNVWGVNESNESDVYKLPFVDISFVPDTVRQFRQPSITANAYDSLDSEDLFDYISDSDGKIVRFKIENSEQLAYSRGKILDSSYDHDGVPINTTDFSSDGKWTFTPDNTSGNTTIEIKIWTDFTPKLTDKVLVLNFMMIRMSAALLLQLTFTFSWMRRRTLIRQSMVHIIRPIQAAFLKPVVKLSLESYMRLTPMEIYHLVSAVARNTVMGCGNIIQVTEAPTLSHPAMYLPSGSIQLFKTGPETTSSLSELPTQVAVSPTLASTFSWTRRRLPRMTRSKKQVPMAHRSLSEILTKQLQEGWTHLIPTEIYHLASVILHRMVVQRFFTKPTVMSSGSIRLILISLKRYFHDPNYRYKWWYN